MVTFARELRITTKWSELSPRTRAAHSGQFPFRLGEVVYDPEKVSYVELLQKFWEKHAAAPFAVADPGPSCFSD